MKFIVIGYDGTDKKSLERRMSVRDAHIAMGDEAVARNEQLLGAALLDDNGDMNGSVFLVDFPSREELNAWLEKEPYVTGNVWKKIEVHPCKIGPSFEHALNNKN